MMKKIDGELLSKIANDGLELLNGVGKNIADLSESIKPVISNGFSVAKDIVKSIDYKQVLPTVFVSGLLVKLKKDADIEKIYEENEKDMAKVKDVVINLREDNYNTKKEIDNLKKEVNNEKEG